MRKYIVVFFLIFIALVVFFQRSKMFFNDTVRVDSSAYLAHFGKEANAIGNLIERYSNEKDSLKIKSLMFLIANAMYHIDDTFNINSSLLEKTVNQALGQCRNELHSGELTFSDFCEYVLPYRIDNEPVEFWRDSIELKYKGLIENSKTAKLSSAQVCSAFNKEVGKGFIYSSTSNGEVASQKNWTRLSSEKKGNCVEMTHSIVFPLRTMGIPVSIDYSTCWGNTNGYCHSWNALILNRHILPFMGLESNPDGSFNPFRLIENKKDQSKTTYRLCGKVLRKTFSINTEIREDDPLFKESRNFRDVTKEYFKVRDLVFPDSDTESLANFYYICVYTDGKWVPIYSGEKRHKQILFRDLACKMLYLPIVYKINEETSAISDPCAVDSNGKSEILKPNFAKTIQIKIETLQSRETAQLNAIAEIGDWSKPVFGSTMEKIADGRIKISPINGRRYQLSYWDKKWIRLEHATAKKNQLQFAGVPSNALYKVSDEQTEGKERVFTYEKGEQIWW